MSIDDLNDKQESAMSELRERIKARREAFELERTERAFDTVLTPQRSLQPLPEVITPVGEWGEFSYERFIEIQGRLDVCYANFLYWQEKQEFGEGFQETLKELIRTVDLYIGESLRVRY